MEEKHIGKDRLRDLLADLTEGRRVFAPVLREGVSAFEEIRGGDEISLSDGNTRESVKGLFFPQRERLFSYREGEIDEPFIPDEKRVVFGVRPCDARSLSLLDRVFDGGDCRDPYYLTRRETALVIAVGCNRPPDTCFCTVTGGGPFSTEGADLLLTDRGESYIAKPVTKEGEEFLRDASGFENAGPDRIAAGRESMEHALNVVNAGLRIGPILEAIDRDFDDPVWETIHEKCIGCGVCTFLCPTCHCFDILDEGDAEGERIRIWDACMFPQFTLHASGANPRPTGKERMRQRVMHKFRYFVENHGEAACTGCGRCVRFCPVNLDIRDVLKRIQNHE
jgi:ferredoxin